MRKLGFVFVFAGVLLIAGSALLHWKGSALGKVPPAVAELERTLARPGLIGLATLDVGALVALGVGEDAEGEEPGLDRELRDTGIDVRRDVSHATLAISARDDGQADVAFALFGRFDAARIEAALRERTDMLSLIHI